VSTAQSSRSARHGLYDGQSRQDDRSEKRIGPRWPTRPPSFRNPALAALLYGSHHLRFGKVGPHQSARNFDTLRFRSSCRRRSFRGPAIERTRRKIGPDLWAAVAARLANKLGLEGRTGGQSLYVRRCAPALPPGRLSPPMSTFEQNQYRLY
jgi:hypothetical protein